MIKIDCEDGVRPSDFDEADQMLIAMIALRLEYAKDVFSQQNHVVERSNDEYEIFTLRDRDRGIECVYRIDSCDESITLRKLTKKKGGGGRF